MGFVLIRAVHWFANLLIYLLIARAILSWFARDPYSQIGKIYMAIIRLTEPMVEPFRRLLAKFNVNTGMLDFSVLLTFFAIEFIERIIITVLYAIFY